MVGGNFDVLVHYEEASASNQEGAICCNTFKWDILWSILNENPIILWVQQQQNEFYSATTGIEKLEEANTML